MAGAGNAPYTFLENQLIESVKYSLRNELYANAAFLCERLFAEVKNEDVRLLLAECYLGNVYFYEKSILICLYHKLYISTFR
jgi:hypothetical protein